MPKTKPQEEPKQTGIRRVTVKAPAENPYLIMAYKVPKLLDVEKDDDPFALEAVMPGIAHASFHQKNYAICYHILESFFSQPAPVYKGGH